MWRVVIWRNVIWRNVIWQNDIWRNDIWRDVTEPNSFPFQHFIIPLSLQPGEYVQP